MGIKNFLFQSIYEFKPPTFGLDLSDLSMKIALLEKKRSSLILKTFGRINFPQGIIKEGEIKKEKELIEIIKKALKETRGSSLKTKHVICSLPEQHAFVRVIQLPKMKIEEAKEAVKWEAEANIPLSIEEVYLDWQIVKPVKDHLDHLDILINAAPKTLVDSYLKVLKEADLKPVAFEIESVGTVRSLVKNGLSLKPVFVIDLGATRTSFIIFSGYVPRLTTSVPVSNLSMIDAVARSLGVKKDEARRLKFEIGLDKKKEKGRVFEALVPSLTQLIREIQKYTEFYKEHARHEHGCSGDISKILLCGGGANLKGLPNYLSDKLKKPVILGNPWVNILKPSLKVIPELSYRESMAYATALGLALRGVGCY